MGNSGAVGAGSGRNEDDAEQREGEERLARELASYREAARFRRNAEKVLCTLGLTFASWRVLEATSRLTASRGDACNHAEVAREIELDEASVLRTMRVLSRLGCVSHDIASEWNLGFRVILTEKGAEQLKLANSALKSSMTNGARTRRRLSPGAAA